MEQESRYRRIPKPPKSEPQQVFVRNFRWAQKRLGLTLRGLAQRAGVNEDWFRRAATQGLRWIKSTGRREVSKLEEFLGCPNHTLWEPNGHRFREGVINKHGGESDFIEPEQCFDEPNLDEDHHPPEQTGEAQDDEPNGRVGIQKPNRQYDLIKWTGSKQRQAKQIVAEFPHQIQTYYEPFLGGGSVLFELLNSNIEVRRIEVSDICEPLIELWKLVRDDPSRLVEVYDQNWRMLQSEGTDHYMKVRREFSLGRNPHHLFFLLRTCRAGHVRFNRFGEFNATYHEANPGMVPETVEKLLKEWHLRLADRDITFSTRDYGQVEAKEGDLVYLDPPYETGSGRYYYGSFDHKELYAWLRQQPCGYLMSLNGYLGEEDRRLDVPKDLYDEHLLIEGGQSRIDRITGREPREVFESLYINRRGGSWDMDKTGG